MKLVPIIAMLSLIIHGFGFMQPQKPQEKRLKKNSSQSNDLPQNNMVWLEAMREEEINISHRTDSLSMFIHVSMLILALLASWLFRLKRFSFFHETGVCLIIGMTAGGIIKLWLSSIDGNSGPDMLTVHLTNANHLAFAPAKLAINISGYEYSYNLEGVISVNSNGVAKDEDVEQLEEKSSFNPEIFFYVLLPPIVFYAGYELEKHYFFRNFGAIFTFSFAGTTISFLVTGILFYIYCRFIATGMNMFDLAECMLFGAIISSTDPVTVLAIFHDIRVEHDLHALVLGESVLNDALSIGLYRSVLFYMSYRPAELRQFSVISLAKATGEFFYVFIGSFFIGVLFAGLTAFITKKTKIGMFPVLETAFFLLMSYATFLLAEVADWSGIVAILFCGIAQKSYTCNNLSHSSIQRISHFFHLLNFLAESFIFTYIGLSVFLFGDHKWNWGFILFTLLSVQFARAANIYPISFFINLFRVEGSGIPIQHQHVLVWSGLRGAMAFALAIRNTASLTRQLILTSTLFCVLFSVVVQGGFTLPFIKLLQIKTGVPPEFNNGDDESSDDDYHSEFTPFESEIQEVVSDETSQNYPIENSEANGCHTGTVKNSQILLHLPQSSLESGNENQLQQLKDVPKSSNYCWIVAKFVQLDKNYIRPLLVDTNRETQLSPWVRQKNFLRSLKK